MEEEINKTEKQYYINQLTFLKKIIYYLKIGRFWKDGNVASFTWNLWNPLALICIVLEFIIILVLFGITGLMEFPGLRLDEYWKEHKNERDFF